jgi:predicted MFS family arabinose efflux permease
MNMVHPVSANFMMDLMQPGQRARMNALKQTANKLAWVAATFAGGYLIQETRVVVDGFTTVMLVTIGLYVAGSAMYWRFFRREPAAQWLPAADEPADR